MALGARDLEYEALHLLYRSGIKFPGREAIPRDLPPDFIERYFPELLQQGARPCREEDLDDL